MLPKTPDAMNATSLFLDQFKVLPYPDTDCSGKTIIITGANVGLGLEAARHCVRLNAAKVILACRSVEKGLAAKADIETSLTGKQDVIEVWQVDQSSFQSVKDFSARVNDTLSRVDVIIQNASVALGGGYEACEEGGYETQLTVNVISTFLMALLVLPALRRSAARHNVLPRLIIIASVGHSWVSPANLPPSSSSPGGGGGAFEVLRGPHEMQVRYNVTKLLQVLLARELAARITTTTTKKKKADADVVVATVDPGLCRTELMRHVPFPFTLIVSPVVWLFGRAAEMGARNHLAAALGMGDGTGAHGRYVASCEVAPESEFVRSEEGRRRGKELFDELLGILEGIAPGVSREI